DRPAASGMLALAAEQCTQARAFLVAHDIVSIPTKDECLVRESPPFMRWNAAFEDGAGVFEQAVLPSFYYISPPDPPWSKEEQESYIPNRYQLLFTTVHEVWPGHFLQGLHLKVNPSRCQKSFSTYSFTEGWAHYTEEMMWQEGLGGGDPKAHVGQLLE